MKNTYEASVYKPKIVKTCLVVILAMMVFFSFWMAYSVYNSYSKKCFDVKSITHMMITSPTITKDGITHEFVSAVIYNDSLYVTVFLHEEDEPVKFTSIATIGDMQYSIYDEDKRLLKLNSSYGNIVHLQAKLAKKSRNTTERFYICSYNKELILLELVDFDVARSTIVSFEDVECDVTVKVVPKYSDGRLKIFVWLLDAPHYCFNLNNVYIASENGQWFGYSESNVYLVDDFNKTYYYIRDDEESCLYFGYHCYFFDLVEVGKKYTLTIPSISYIDNNSEEVITVEGPFTYEIIV